MNCHAGQNSHKNARKSEAPVPGDGPFFEPFTWLLSRGAWTAAIHPERGAQVLSLRYNGRPVLREPDALAALDAEPMLYGIPFLFPPNRVAGGRFVFDGKSYELPLNESARNNHIHGLFAGAVFTVAESGPSHLTTKLENTGEAFSFPCRVIMRDRLGEDGFCRETEIENTGTTDMPVEMGFHTTFAAPGAFQVPLDQRWETDERFLPTGRLVSLDSKEQDIVAGCGPRGSRVSGFYTAQAGSVGRLARIGAFYYQVSEEFTDWVLFSRDGESWVCVEPQSGPVNQLNHPECRRLAPGEKICFWQRISLADRKAALPTIDGK